MKELVVARAYAQAIVDLGTETKTNVADEMTKLQEAINSSNDLENVLFMEVFTVEEKHAVFGEIAKKLHLSQHSTAFVNYLIDSKRMNLFPMVYKEVIVLDDHEKGFIRGTIEGADKEIDSKQLEDIKNFIKTKLNRKPELNYIHNPNLTAGYKIRVEDFQVDATIDNQLEQFKNTIIGE